MARPGYSSDGYETALHGRYGGALALQREKLAAMAQAHAASSSSALAASLSGAPPLSCVGAPPSPRPITAVAIAQGNATGWHLVWSRSASAPS